MQQKINHSNNCKHVNQMERKDHLRKILFIPSLTFPAIQEQRQLEKDLRGRFSSLEDTKDIVARTSLTVRGRGTNGKILSILYYIILPVYYPRNILGATLISPERVRSESIKTLKSSYWPYTDDYQ